MKRDRDTTVTDAETAPFPVLVRAHSRRDGLILLRDGLQIEVAILPLEVVQGLFDEKLRHKYGGIYDKVSEEELTELQALAVLVSAASQPGRTPEQMDWYMKRMAPLEEKRALQRERKQKVLQQFNVAMRMLGGDTTQMGQVRDEPAATPENLQERAKFPWREMHWRLNEWSQRARVVLYSPGHERQLKPGLYCESMAVAIATLLFSRIASPKNFSICERCGNPFIRSKRVQRFCSLRCGNADRKARERASTGRTKGSRRIQP